MNRKKLERIKRAMRDCWRSPQKARDLESLARSLGRKRVNRGKEPVWESNEFDELFPLAIPHHGGKDLAPGTRRSILEQLENDVFAWEARLENDNDAE